MLESFFRRGGNLIGPGDPSALSWAGNTPAVLAIHGFGGTPFEVQLVREAALEAGLGGGAPLLPGHGTHARELATRTWTDWTQAVEAEVEAADEPVIVAGLSLGSLLAMHLAATKPSKVRALVVIANAIRLFSPFPTRLLGAVEKLRIPDFWLPKVTSDIADPAARRTHVTYDTQPVHAAVRVLRAGERVRGLLPNIVCPTLVLHGRRDRVCPSQNADEVLSSISSTDKKCVVFPLSRHILTRDVERHRVRAEMTTFFRRFCG